MGINNIVGQERVGESTHNLTVRPGQDVPQARATAGPGSAKVYHRSGQDVPQIRETAGQEIRLLPTL